MKKKIYLEKIEKKQHIEEYLKSNFKNTTMFEYII